jgi:hypothetical protein
MIVPKMCQLPIHFAFASNSLSDFGAFSEFAHRQAA